jgi:hypothetical protein
VKDKTNNASLRQVFGSVFAAMMGVQSDKNRERDFKAANPRTYIIAGVIFTICFVASIIGVVSIVTS